ncbi:MAG: baseplate J/gp47 family protein [Gammaproteobacteria bacterium]
MPFTRPTLEQLIDRDAADFETRLPGTDARLRRSNLGVLSRVVAGAAHGLYGFLAWLARQLFADTSEVEFLERQADVYGIARKAAVAASGNVTLTGTTGAVVPAGTVLQRSDGARFTTDAEVTLASGTATAAVTAEAGGLDGNTAAASALTLVSAIGGVNSTAAVAAGGLDGGTDTESDDALRARLLDRIRQPPHGGAKFDYSKWALEVPGVTRVWVAPLELGLGTVTVRFVVDDDPGGPIPDAGQVAAVQAYIDDPLRRPVTADVTVVAPAAVPLDLTIAGLVASTGADLATVKAAITAELEDLLLREAEPGGTILLSHLREAISLAAGEYDHALTTPSADVTHTTGQLATLGTITWA